MVKKISMLHIASFNGNIGDNANHNGFRNRLKQALKRDIEYNEIEIREFYQSWNIRDFNSDGFINLCNNYDLVIIGGGNFFELKWEYSHTGTTINITNETLDRINTPIFFNAVGCDIAKGVTGGTINKFKNFLEKITNSDKYLVSVRNDGSYETINKLYGNRYKKRIHRVADGAFFLETKSFNFPELNNKYKSVGINIVSDMKDIRFGNQIENGIEYNEFIDGMAKVTNSFLGRNNNYQIIFFPHIYSDLLAIYELLEKINDRYRRTRAVVAPYLTGTGSDKYIFGLYKECHFVLGMRFHSNVCSIAQEIPTIALSSYKKIKDLYEEVQLSDRIIEVNKVGFENKLEEQIKYTINNLEQIKVKYKKSNETIYLESNNFYDNVKSWCEENNII